MKVTHNKLVKSFASSLGLLTLRFGSPLPKRYTMNEDIKIFIASGLLVFWLVPSVVAYLLYTSKAQSQCYDETFMNGYFIWSGFWVIAPFSDEGLSKTVENKKLVFGARVSILAIYLGLLCACWLNVS